MQQQQQQQEPGQEEGRRYDECPGRQGDGKYRRWFLLNNGTIPVCELHFESFIRPQHENIECLNKIGTLKLGCFCDTTLWTDQDLTFVFRERTTKQAFSFSARFQANGKSVSPSRT